MNNISKDQDLVFKYDKKILIEIIDILKSNNYLKLQYIPTRQNILAIIKEHQNMLNIISKTKHLLFYYSLYPKIYRIFMRKKLQYYLDICFFNKAIDKQKLIEIFPQNLINKALSNNIILKEGGLFRFSISFVPFANYILIRDKYQVYDKHELDPEKFDQRVWMGADSIIFSGIIKKCLKNKSFNRGIEIGSGAGIQAIISSTYTRSFEAIDCNNRAVQYTKLNASINKIKNIKTNYSNLFENIEGDFDLILANPWFIDIDKGGLEEVPYIMGNLGTYLRKNGLCLLLLNSFIKNGRDTVYDYFKNFIKSADYNIDLYTLGYSISTNRKKEYKDHGIHHEVSYYAIIQKNGGGILNRHETSLFRWIRDFLYIFAYRILNRH